MYRVTKGLPSTTNLIESVPRRPFSTSMWRFVEAMILSKRNVRKKHHQLFDQHENPQMQNQELDKEDVQKF
jgi:hypothetical protein